jgi:hypothetical protein
MPKKINNVLVTHALKNVWTSPSQDLQYILQPKRITRKEGNYNYVKIVTDVYDLPKTEEKSEDVLDLDESTEGETVVSDETEE